MPEVRRRQVRKRRRKDGLVRFARNVHSQSGEDGILEAIFDALDGRDCDVRWCVDVGAWDGVHLSNTYALLATGWRGLLVEADEARFASLQALHAPLGNACVRALVSCVAGHDVSLSAILRRSAPPEMGEIDLLSIDVDGPDYWLLKDVFDARWRPRVVVVEFNPTIPHDVVFVQDRDDGVRHGSSLAALDELARAHGYRLAETTTYNALFARGDAYDVLCRRGLCRREDDLDDLHDFSMGTNVYQLYDGTLKLAGCKKLLWHRRPLEEDKIQHLPRADRVYPFAPPKPPYALVSADPRRLEASLRNGNNNNNNTKKPRKRKKRAPNGGCVWCRLRYAVMATSVAAALLALAACRRRRR